MKLPKKRSRAEVIAAIRALRDEYNAAYERWKNGDYEGASKRDERAGPVMGRGRL